MEFKENNDSLSDSQYFDDFEFDENYDSSSDCQYVDDFGDVEDSVYIEENDDFCILDLEDKKIDELAKTMNNYKLRLENFDAESLYNISELKKNIYLLCEDNRYLIDDSKFLSNLELLISKHISCYEDKLFMLSEQLVDTEINKELASQENSETYDKVKENHERLIYGEKLANERKLAREKLAKEKDVENIHYLIKLEKERKLEKENTDIRNYINSIKGNNTVTPIICNQSEQLENARKLEKENDDVRNYINSLKDVVSPIFCNKEEKGRKRMILEDLLPKISQYYEEQNLTNIKENDTKETNTLSEYSVKFYNNKNMNIKIDVPQNLIGSIFTNCEYGIIKENLCFAYQITEIKNNIILAVSLKLDTITIPKQKRINSMSDCGSKKLHEPIEIISEAVMFEKSSFGKKCCIKNNSLYLVEYDNQLNVPIWTTIDNNWDR
jgi:hypothetical protein